MVFAREMFDVSPFVFFYVKEVGLVDFRFD